MAEAQTLSIEVTLIGSGELREAALELAGRLRKVRLHILEPVTYGTPFLSLLRDFHAALVPSLTDEQPRIIFDAFSQAVPVLASDTAGHRDLVIPGSTGQLFAPGSAEALLVALRRVTDDPSSLLQMGLAGLEIAAGQTRARMHLDRARQLANVFKP
jgi:glycosyltransferase involved in cell wall biosynthesis